MLPLGLTLEELRDWALDAPLRIVLILIGAAIISRLARRGLKLTLRRMSQTRMRERLASARTLAPSSLLETREHDAERTSQRLDALGAVLASAAAFLIWLIALFMVLSEVQVDLAPLLAGAGIAGIALGFGAQSLVRDFLSGAFILIEDQFAVGDIVDLGEAVGVVEGISLRTARLRSVEGIVWHIPNGEIHRVGNHSQHWSRSLIDVEVAYGTDLERAKQVMDNVARELAGDDPDILEEPEVWGVEALGVSGITLRMVVKTRPSENWRINRVLRQRIKEAFEAEGIEIPFPQQTVWYRGEPGAPEVPGPPEVPEGS